MVSVPSKILVFATALPPPPAAHCLPVPLYLKSVKCYLDNGADKGEKESLRKSGTMSNGSGLVNDGTVSVHHTHRKLVSCYIMS